MAEKRFVPIIVGVGDIVNRSVQVEDAREPATLMIEAINRALQDSGLADLNTIKQNIDSIDVVACWTWPYDNLPDLLAKRLGVNPSHRFIPSSHGGNQPAQLLDNAARRISVGKARVAVVCGGEALASLAACAKARKLPPPGWAKPSKMVDSVFSPTTRELEIGLGKPHKIGAPIHIYPLYENAFRASQGQTIQENHADSVQMYADFARVAQNHPYAWNYGKPAETTASIGTISEKNRLICFPYLLLMNAFNTVNLAAACIVTSVEFAEQIGIPEDRWVYPLGGAGTRDSHNFWERPNYHTSPSISKSLDAALDVSGLTKRDIDTYDFYSCFPIVPKIACHHLGLSIRNPEKPITLLGGLTSFGGAGNNYSMHALTEMVTQIRVGKAKTGLVLANGGWLTYQHVICLSRQPRKSDTPYPGSNPLPEILVIQAPPVDADVEGDATIETYTVEYDRSNHPIRGHIVGRMKATGHRFLANHGDAFTLEQLASFKQEPIGRAGIVKRDQGNEGRNLFSLNKDVKL